MNFLFVFNFQFRSKLELVEMLLSMVSVLELYQTVLLMDFKVSVRNRRTVSLLETNIFALVA